MKSVALLSIPLISFGFGCEQQQEKTQVSDTQASEAQTEAQVTPAVALSPSETKNTVNKIQNISATSPDESVISPLSPFEKGLVLQSDSSLSKNPKRPDLQIKGITSETQVVVASPPILDLGEISTSEKAKGTVTLTNTSGAPVTILTAKASCGCTTSDFKNNTVLGPGESVEVVVVMDGKGRARTISKVVTFSIDGYPSIRYPVEAKAISYVTLDVGTLTIDEENGKTELILTSIDEQPFKIISMIPAISEPFSNEASSTQKLTLNWDRFWDEVKTTKMTIRLDHPLCSEITTSVRLNPEQRQRLNDIIVLRRSGNVLLDKDPTRPLTGDQLAQYIKVGQGAKVLRYITEGKGKFDAVDRSGVTLLSISSQEGDADTVLGLLEMGADLESVDRVNRTPLMYAARSKDPEAIRILLEAGANLQAVDNLGNTPLSWAAGFGSANGVRELIDAGADANTKDFVLGYTPLLWASGFGDSLSIPILISADADVNIRDNAEGRSPLMHAMRTGSVEGVEALLLAGANVNDIDNAGLTALLIGAGNNNVKIDKIMLLVENGADVSQTDRDGMTALKHAKTRTDEGASEIVQYLEERTPSE